MKSIITEYTASCVLCGREATDTHHLLLGSDRQHADEDGLTIPLCRECLTYIHNDSRTLILGRILGQIAWEGKYGDRDDFRKRYKRSYV